MTSLEPLRFLQIQIINPTPETPQIALYALDSEGRIWRTLTPEDHTTWVIIFPGFPQAPGEVEREPDNHDQLRIRELNLRK